MVHFSFDLWTSGNALSITGVVVHFIDKSGKIWNSLLGLPAHHESHSGYNIAETVASVLVHWNLQDKLSYFTSDNVSNNDTCMEWLAAEFGFNHRHRRVRCVGHVINLVDKAVIIGTGDPLDIFEQELDAMAREEREQLIHWRRRGPVGKLHNIIVFICRSTQRIDLFEKLQRLAIDTEFQFTEEVYKLVRDHDTRWNSLFSMIERAVKLRAAIDEFIVKQIGKWTEYETRWQANQAHKKKPPKKKAPPSIIADQLTPDNWHILSQYYRSTTASFGRSNQLLLSSKARSDAMAISGRFFLLYSSYLNTLSL